MKKFLAILLTAAMLSVLLVPFSLNAAISASDLAYAPEAASAPTLDGVADDIYLTAPEYVLGRIMKNDSADKGANRTTSVVTFRMAYYGEALYYYVDIVDDTLINDQSGAHWQNDSLFIYFSEDCNATGFNTSNGLSYQIYVIIKNTETPQQLLTRKGVTLSEDAQYFCKVETTETGYHASLEICLRTKHDGVVKKDGKSAFDLQFNDADRAATGSSENNRTSVWCWAVDGDGGPNTSTAWGYVKYVADTVTLFDNRTEWHYMTATQTPDAAPEGWNKSLTVSSEWTVAPAPFGCRAPGCTKNWGTVQDPQNTDGTCDNAYFWAVKEVTLSAEQVAALSGKALLSSMFYDQNINVYINGILLYEHNGENNLYRNKKLADNAADVLHEGENVIAVSLHQMGGGYEFDMNLYATSGDTAKFSAQTKFETIALDAGQNYKFYHQTRTGVVENTTDYRILFVADKTWLEGVPTLTAEITFKNNDETKTATLAPDTVYYTVTAPNSVYRAEDGAVIFGWIITEVPNSFTSAEGFELTAKLITE